MLSIRCNGLEESSRAALVVLALVFVPTAAFAQSASSDWPGFRGPQACGVAAQSGVFPADGEIGLTLAWKTKIGSGYSGVAVAGGRAVTAFSDGQSDVMAAFDLKTGAEKWRVEMDTTYKGHDGSHDGPIATPIIADGRVVGLAPRGRLFAVSLDAGELAWSTNLPDDHGAKKPHYGFSTSPIVLDGMVMVEIGAEKAMVAGFDLATGERRWTAGEDGMSFQSPMLMPIGGHTCLLAPGENILYGIDPGSGKLLWEYKHGGSGPYGASSMTPVPAGPDRLLLKYKDDAATMVSMSTSGGNVAFETRWEDNAIRNTYNIPIYHDGHIYAYSTRFLTCLDAETGKTVWRSRQPGDGFLVLIDGHLVIATKEGGVHVARATPSAYEERAAIAVFGDIAWGHPAFADGAIFVRSVGEIARVDIERGAAPTAVTEDTGGEPPAGSAFATALAAIRAAPDKASAVDALMAGHPACPIIEGNDWVHFVYYGPADDVALGGDILGARQDRPLNRVEGTDLFYYSVRLEPDARVNYVFIRDYEEITDPRNDRKTFTKLLGKDMELSFNPQPFEMSWVSMPRWTPPAHLNEPDASRRGRMEKRTLTSKALESDIEIDVYLPLGYDEGEERYPVAYVLDRDAAGDSGRYPQSLDNLIGKSVRPVIAVFLDPAPWFKNQQYAQMLATELVPYVDENFRTMASADARACLGTGFGSGDALLCTMGNPTVIGKVACQSPFMFSTMQDAVVGMLAGMEGDKPLVYVDWGKYDLRNPHENWNTADRAKELADTLRKGGCTVVGGEANDGCDWPSWRNRTDKVFAAIFPLESAK